ncbi:MAG: hypothetical protein LUG84_05205 [Akkermansiaceae bacterium]|nr:hypothetical protein [Akkermansiaceae bacterium]
MNMFLISVPVISAVLCGAGAYAADIKAPASIAGATIKLNGAVYSPGDVTIEQYEPDKNTARVIMRYSKQLMPRISGAAALTGAASVEEVYEGKVKPAVVTFTGQESRVYSGTVSGSLYRSSFYRGKEDEEIIILKNEKIEFILNDDDRSAEGTVNGPSELVKGTIIQIRTDKRSFIFKIMDDFGTKYFLKYPDEKTAVFEPAELPKDTENPNVSFWLSGDENLEEVMTADNPPPYIAFTKKLSDKIYEGSLFGWLYGYTEAPSSNGSTFPAYVIQFKERLLGITIVLP